MFYYKIKDAINFFKTYLLGVFFKKMGKGCLIDFPTIRLTPAFIIMENNVVIGKHARIQAIKKYNKQIFKPIIIFEDNSSCQQNLHLTCAEKVIIGKNTALAANVTITDINHQYRNPNLPVELQDLDVEPVQIGPDCKIYNNVVILGGTTLGRHCVVGANSVVKGNFSDYSIIVGSPAETIKKFDPIEKTWKKIK